MFKNLKYHFLMHVIVFTWGFTGILGKLIELEFYQIVFFRVTIAGLSILLFLLMTGKSFRVDSMKSLFKIVGIGVLVTLHWLTFFKSIQVSTASVAVLCLSTTTLHVSWIEPIVMKRKFIPMEFIFGLLVIAGIGFVSGNIDSSQYEGIIWGLLSALLAALFSVLNLRLNREGIKSSTITVYEMFTGTVILGLFLFFNGTMDVEFFQIDLKNTIWMLVLGVVCTTAPFMLMIDVANKLGAFTSSLTINLEPVYSIVLAIFILKENEVLGPNFYIGAMFIIIVVFLNPIVKYYMKSEDKSV